MAWKMAAKERGFAGAASAIGAGSGSHADYSTTERTHELRLGLYDGPVAKILTTSPKRGISHRPPSILSLRSCCRQSALAISYPVRKNGVFNFCAAEATHRIQRSHRLLKRSIEISRHRTCRPTLLAPSRQRDFIRVMCLQPIFRTLEGGDRSSPLR